jgi:CHAT domain-containing protein
MKTSGLLTLLLSHLILFSVALPHGIPVKVGLGLAKTQTNRSSQSHPEILVGQTVVKTLEGNSQNRYKFDTRPGYVSRFDVIQNGVDVVINIRDPEGIIVKSTDRPSGSYGRESVTFISSFEGVAVIEISAYIPETADGSYELKFIEFREASATDDLRSRAEDLTSSAEAARGQRPREKKLEAIEKFGEALDLWREIGDEYEQAVALYGLGFTHFSISNHFEAASCYQLALKIMNSLGDAFGQAINHSALGAVQYSLGELTLSAFNYRRAIEIYRKLENRRGLGIAFHGLGTTELLAENYGSAINTLEESYRWREIANDQSGRLLTGFTLVNLHLLTGNISEAGKQIRVVEQLLGPNRSVNNAEYQYFSGRVAYAEGRFEDAQRFLQKGITIYRSEGNRLRIAQSLYELSRASEGLGQLELADDVIAEGIGIVEELRESTPNFRSRLNFTALIQPFFAQQVRVLSLRWRRSPSDVFVERAFSASERGRSRGLFDRLERRELLRSTRIDASLLEKESGLRDAISEALEELSRNSDDKALSRLQELSADYLAVEAEISNLLNVPEQTRSEVPTIREIQSYLREDEAVLSVSSISSETLVWLITVDGFKFIATAENNEVARNSEKLFDCISVRPKTLNETCDEFAASLGRMILGPIERILGEKKLLVVKDGVLEKIPFQALRVPSTGKYLIESNQIVSIPSVSLMRLMIERQSNPRDTPIRIAVFADPVYDSADERIPLRNRGRSTDLGPDLPRLFSSRFEANRIQTQRKSNIDLFLDFEATTDAFQTLALNEYSIIHFATHAVIDDRTPDLSAIILSRVDRNGNPIRSSIKLTDLERLDLNTDLVFLSACQTGFGRQIRGEGFISLGQSFYATGAKAVIFTGWKIDDRVTAELVSRFYGSYLGQAKPVPLSLREAQISVLRDRRTSHPFYWSGFILQSSYK